MVRFGPFLYIEWVFRSGCFFLQSMVRFGLFLDRMVKLVLSSVFSGCRCDYNLDYVCGEDGKTYDNDCEAACKGVEIQGIGPC